MNAKVKKMVQLTAAALFLIALLINVKVTNNDPFQMINELAIATGTGSNSCSESDPWGPYPGYTTLLDHLCQLPDGTPCGIESYCIQQYGSTCYPEMCAVIIDG